MKISTILDHIDRSAIALPDLRHGQAVSRDQVRGRVSRIEEAAHA